MGYVYGSTESTFRKLSYTECVKEIFALIAVILALAGGIPYVRSIIGKRSQPHPYTWLVSSVVSLITLFGMVVKGAGVGAIPTAVAEGFTIIIFLFSLKYGFKKIPRSDSFFLLIALLGIVPWILTKDPTISVIIAVGIDLVSFVPTLKKTWRYPETEAVSIYSMNVLRHLFTLASLGSYNIATTFHSYAMILLNCVMTMFIFRKEILLGLKRK